ncbi:hypothetical protein EG329_009933 [Mollisiaceae sp. DMI_Dod_QoI]|nr:hypothetical protein EG329_009933 [Helotiales sp. DMI_Dod_QoI]
MELAAAAGSAATVVQLADFAARTIKSTTSFFASVASASRELEILRLRVQHLEHLFDNTRALACSYQNTPLALEPQNQRTLDLLGHALTKCSVDLQELNCVLQKPVTQTDWTVVRMKRRIKHVLDEATLRRLSARLQDGIVSLNSLLSCISMHNDSIIHGSIRQVASQVQFIPQISAQLSNLHQHGTQPLETLLDRVDKILENISLSDNRIALRATANESQVNGPRRRFQATEYTHSGFNTIGRFEVPCVSTGDLLPALELFEPAFRTGMQFLYTNQKLRVSKGAMSWVSSAFYELLADVYRSAARSYIHTSTDENEVENGFSGALVPRRFYRKTEIPVTSTSTRTRTVPSLISASQPLTFVDQQTLYADCEGLVTTSSGRLSAHFEGTHGSEQWPIGESESGLASICFIPRLALKLPGIGIVFFKQPEGADKTCECFLTIFNVLHSDAPIIRAINDGDHGVSQVLRMLKSGEHWAGDRDEDGRSLLSYAIESRSRDMSALLFHMGAYPQDSHNFKQMIRPCATHQPLSWG